MNYLFLIRALAMKVDATFLEVYSLQQRPSFTVFSDTCATLPDLAARLVVSLEAQGRLHVVISRCQKTMPTIGLAEEVHRYRHRYIICIIVNITEDPSVEPSRYTHRSGSWEC